MKLSQKSPDTERRDIADMELGDKFLNALLDSEADCGQETFKTLLQDASSINPTVRCENRDTSQIRINTMSDEILQKTLKAWNKGYELKIAISPSNVITKKNPANGCAGKRVLRSAQRYIPDGISLELKICELK